MPIDRCHKDSSEEDESGGRERDVCKLLDEIDDPVLLPGNFTALHEERGNDVVFYALVRGRKRRRRVMKIDEKAFCGERITG